MSSEKTERPTQKKKQDARKKGQVAKSMELPVGCQLAVALIYLTTQGEKLNKDVIQLIHLTIDSLLLPIEQGMQIFIQGFIMLVFTNFLFISVILIAITVISFIAQTGFLMATESIGFKVEKFNIANNLKQLISVKNIFDLLKSLTKIIIITCVFSYLIYHYGGVMQYLPTLSLSDSLNVIYKMIYWLWGALVICYLFFFMADFTFQRRQMMKQLMMSKEEIKQEFKNAEGNQEIKGHRRAMHQEIQSGSLAASVRKSSVIVRNPTHVAIGIHYQKDVTSLPKVTVKGVDEMAKWIVELAVQGGVPIIEDVWLARTLLREVNEGQFIPSSLFEPVAELLWLINEIQIETT